jgi:hypothetical protein
MTEVHASRNTDSSNDRPTKAVAPQSLPTPVLSRLHQQAARPRRAALPPASTSLYLWHAQALWIGGDPQTLTGVPAAAR